MTKRCAGVGQCSLCCRHLPFRFGLLWALTPEAAWYSLSVSQARRCLGDSPRPHIQVGIFVDSTRGARSLCLLQLQLFVWILVPLGGGSFSAVDALSDLWIPCAMMTTRHAGLCSGARSACVRKPRALQVECFCSSDTSASTIRWLHLYVSTRRAEPRGLERARNLGTFLAISGETIFHP